MFTRLGSNVTQAGDRVRSHVPLDVRKGQALLQPAFLVKILRDALLIAVQHLHPGVVVEGIQGGEQSGGAIFDRFKLGAKLPPRQCIAFP